MAAHRDDAVARTTAIATTVVVLGIVAIIAYLGHLVGRPDGFHQDESAIAYNAWTIASGGVDEHGTPWPLLFRSFDDWKSPPYIYTLAGVFAVTGPSIEVARGLSAIAGLTAGLLLGALAWVQTRNWIVVAVTAATALLTPWLFEVSRLVFEVAMLPALLAGLLVALRLRPPDTRLSWGSTIALAVLLALITYSYQLGRLLGPLLAAGLVLFATRRSWPSVARIWAVFALCLVPLVAMAIAVPESASNRIAEAGYLGRPIPDIIATFLQRLVSNADPVHMLVLGDPNPRHHVQGIMGSLLAPTLVLALLTVALAARRGSRDRWTMYLLFGAVASLVPASLTLDEFHVNRLIGVPVFLIALTIPATVWLLGGERGVAWRRAAFGVLTLATVAQGAWFQVRYDTLARDRGGWFDAEYPRLLDVALATGADPIYLEDGIVPGYVHGLWYGAVRGVPQDRFVHLPRDTRAPAGAVVLSSVTDCAPCEELDAGGFFRVYRIP